MQYSVIENGQVARKLRIDPDRPQPFQLAVATADHKAGVAVSNIELLSDAEKRKFGVFRDSLVNDAHDPDYRVRTGPVEEIRARSVLVTYTLADRPDAEIRKEQLARAKQRARQLHDGYRDTWPGRPARQAYEDELRAALQVFKTDLQGATGATALKTTVDALSLPVR